MMLTVTQQKVLLVLKGKRMTLTDLFQEARMSPNTVQKAVEELKSLSLVEEDREDTFPKRRYFTLSNKGNRVAELLEKMDKIIYG